MTIPSPRHSPVRFARAPHLALAIALVTMLGLAGLGEMRLYYDYAWQLMSVQDHARGDTASPFVMRSADHGDLTRDRTEWTIGYPLAYNAVGAVLCSTGLPPGATHRIIATGAVILGILGWHLLLAQCTPLPPFARAAALLLVGLSLNGAGMISFMMPEVFLFATVPWQMWSLWLLTSNDTPSRRRLLLAGLLGATTGVAYTFRYVAALHGLPLLAFAAGWLLWRRPQSWWPAGLVLALSAALPVAAMSVINFLQVGAINSTSSNLPWGIAARWPDLGQWLLVLTGPVQALFGSAIVYDRAGIWLGEHGLGLAGFDALKLCSRWLAAGPTVLTALLLFRFAPRGRLLAAGLAGLAGTGLGLLWLYSHSGLPQPDSRYSIASALLLWPTLAGAALTAWHHSRRWRVASWCWPCPRGRPSFSPCGRMNSRCCHCGRDGSVTSLPAARSNRPRSGRRSTHSFRRIPEMWSGCAFNPACYMCLGGVMSLSPMPARRWSSAPAGR